METLGADDDDKIYKRIRPREINSLVRIVSNVDKSLEIKNIRINEERKLVSEIGKDIYRLQKLGVPDQKLEGIVSLLPSEAFPRPNVNANSFISSITDMGGDIQHHASHTIEEVSAKRAPSARSKKRVHRFHKKIIL